MDMTCLHIHIVAPEKAGSTATIARESLVGACTAGDCSAALLLDCMTCWPQLVLEHSSVPLA